MIDAQTDKLALYIYNERLCFQFDYLVADTGSSQMAYPLHKTQQSNNYCGREREKRLVLMNQYEDYIDTLYI